jgi:diadenosine tetraphosphate (Ap4A) HIT family hydrolase
MLMGMGSRTWPEDWEDRREGAGCSACANGRTDDIGDGVRFFAGEVSDAYLMRSPKLPGYSVVTWRGRHVADPTMLEPDEISCYWAEVSTVARVIEAVYSPCHLNFQLLGNRMPHVHTHLIARYLDDEAPEAPIDPVGTTPIPEDQLVEQVALLRAALGSLKGDR